MTTPTTSAAPSGTVGAVVRPSVAEHRAFMRGYRMGFRRARLDGVEDAKRAWSAWLDARNHRKRDDWHDDLCPMCGREMAGPNSVICLQNPSKPMPCNETESAKQ